MPVCSYLVIPESDAIEAVVRGLAALPGCDVVRAENRDVLLLVTETAGPREESALREAVASVPGIRSLVLTFGELEPGPDPVGGPLAGPVALRAEDAS